jgi:hypothetical protein
MPYDANGKWVDANGQPKAASPGIGGAISDAIGAAAKAFGPKAITQRKAKLDSQEAEANGDKPLGESFP